MSEQQTNGDGNAQANEKSNANVIKIINNQEISWLMIILSSFTLILVCAGLVIFIIFLTKDPVLEENSPIILNSRNKPISTSLVSRLNVNIGEPIKDTNSRLIVLRKTNNGEETGSLSVDGNTSLIVQHYNFPKNVLFSNILYTPLKVEPNKYTTFEIGTKFSFFTKEGTVASQYSFEIGNENQKIPLLVDLSELIDTYQSLLNNVKKQVSILDNPTPEEEKNYIFDLIKQSLPTTQLSTQIALTGEALQLNNRPQAAALAYVEAEELKPKIIEQFITEQQSSEIQTEVGKIYVAKEKPQFAVSWFSKAANTNYAPAQHQLALLYQHGKGVPKDEKKAQELFDKAKENKYIPPSTQINSQEAPKTLKEQVETNTNIKDSLDGTKESQILSPTQINSSQKPVKILKEQVKVNKTQEPLNKAKENELPSPSINSSQVTPHGKRQIETNTNIKSSLNETDKRDFRDANLSNMNLSNENLSYSDFRGANLSSVNLTNANLSYSDFRGANLSNAILMGADVTCTKFDGNTIPMIEASGAINKAAGAVNVVYCRQLPGIDAGALNDSLKLNSIDTRAIKDALRPKPKPFPIQNSVNENK